MNIEQEMALERGVLEVIAEQLKVKPEEILRGDSLEGDLGADSLDRVEIAMALEERFGFEVSDRELERIQTVADCIEVLLGRVGR